MFLQFNSETMRINDLVNRQAKDRATDKRFLEYHIQKFLSSPVRRDMLTAYRYYNGDQDILKRERTVIGQNGELEPIYNLPNNKLIDNQYAKLVDQKTNYILGKPIGFDGEENDLKIINRLFDKKFNLDKQEFLHLYLRWGHELLSKSVLTNDYKYHKI